LKEVGIKPIPKNLSKKYGMSYSKLKGLLKKKMHNISYFIISLLLLLLLEGDDYFSKLMVMKLKNRLNNQCVWCHILYLHNIGFHMIEKHPILMGSIHLQKPFLIFLLYLNTIVKPTNSVMIFHIGNAHPLKIRLGFNVEKR